MNPVKRALLVLAATAMLLLAFTAVASAQTYPVTPGPAVGAGGAAAGTGSQLPFTGSNHAAQYALIGASAVLVGGGLVVMSRRRLAVSRS